MVVGQCADIFGRGFYSLITTSGYNTYALQYYCSDASCSNCTAPQLLALDVCVPYNFNGMNASIVLTPSRCQAALTDPSVVPPTSITVLWRNNTQTCTNSTHANTITFSDVTSTLTCLPFAYGTYAGLVQNNNGTYTGGVWCDSSCNNCQQPIVNLRLNTCLQNQSSGASLNILLTNRVPTCFVPNVNVFLSILNNP